MKEGALQKFVTNTDETSTFIITSKRTGRRYCVEPMGDPHIQWGSIDPASGPNGKLMHKKSDGRHRGSIDEKDSLITAENGVQNIVVLEPGTSPLLYVDHVDAQYPSV